MSDSDTTSPSRRRHVRRSTREEEEDLIELPEDDFYGNPNVADELEDGEVGGKVDLPVNCALSKSKSKKLKSLMARGIERVEVKDVKGSYPVDLEDSSFEFMCPEMDEAMYRRLKVRKNSSAKKSSIDSLDRDLFGIQSRVLDLARPLLFLWGREFEDAECQKAIESAVKLWSAAFAHITDRRRKNILKQTNPSFLSLLEEPSNFSSSEVNDLFGRKFIKKMVEAAEMEAKLDQADSLRSSSRGRSGGPGFRSAGGRSSSRGARGGHSSNQFSNNHSSARGGFNNNSNYPQRYLSPRLSVLKLPIAGRLSHFINAWRDISPDPWILDVIEHGYRLELESPPHQLSFPNNLVFTDQQRELCTREVEGMLAKGAIVPVLRENVTFISGIFVVPKPSGGWRPVINLKSVNKCIVYRHFKMEGLSTVRHLISPEDWLAKLDLTDAYFTVPLHPSHQPFLQFLWDNVFYQLTFLPFGLSSAPWAFTKVLKPVISFLRERGIRLVAYLDDILIINSSRLGLVKDIELVRSTLERLGFVISEEKSVTSPTQILEYLGLMVDSILMSFSLPSRKVDRVLSQCRSLLSAQSVSLRDLHPFSVLLIGHPLLFRGHRPTSGHYSRTIFLVRRDLEAT